MTRKDYVRLAAALRSARCSYHFPDGSASAKNVAVYQSGVENAAAYIADALAADNPRFDRIKFLAACWVAP